MKNIFWEDIIIIWEWKWNAKKLTSLWKQISLFLHKFISASIYIPLIIYAQKVQCILFNLLRCVYEGCNGIPVSDFQRFLLRKNQTLVQLQVMLQHFRGKNSIKIFKN